MKPHHVASMVIASSVLAAAVTLAAQDRWSLKSPSGISFAEVKDSDSWQMVGSSMPDDEGGCGTAKAPGCIKSIVGNPVLIKAYSEGFPANGKPVPDGAAFAKIEWAKARDRHSPYGAFVPGPLSEVGRVHGKGLEALPEDGRMGVCHVPVRHSNGYMERERR